MKTDVYLRFTTTLTVALLALILWKLWSLAPSKMETPSPLAQVHYVSGVYGNFLAIDDRTGDIWYYQREPVKDERGNIVRDKDGDSKVHLVVGHEGRITKLGDPISGQQQ